MKSHTAALLAAINQRFYASEAAEDFSQTRRRPWGGWDLVLSAYGDNEALRVLDVGCGDGRLAAYLRDRRRVRHYLGLDGSQRLLALARARQFGDWAHFQETNLLEHGEMRAQGPFDLVALFGVLHHIPGPDHRRQLLSQLRGQLAPGARVAITIWRFDRDPAFARRVLPWRQYNADNAQPIPTGELQPGDVLLRWGDGDALRYCHFPQQHELVELFAGAGLRVEGRFMADGRGDRLNEYFLLRNDA